MYIICLISKNIISPIYHLYDVPFLSCRTIWYIVLPLKPNVRLSDLDLSMSNVLVNWLWPHLCQVPKPWPWSMWCVGLFSYFDPKLKVCYCIEVSMHQRVLPDSLPHPENSTLGFRRHYISPGFVNKKNAGSMGSIFCIFNKFFSWPWICTFCCVFYCESLNR